MRLSRLLAVFLLLAFAPFAKAQEELSSDQWNDVVGFIDQTLGTAKSGSDNPRQLEADLAINVVPQKAVSRSTGEICGAGCYDPCRGFDLSVTREGEQAIFRYSGRRCAVSSDFAQWGPDGPITLDRVLRSGPDPDLVRRAASYLAVLAYLPEGFGKPDANTTLAALRVFRSDAQLRVEDEGDITASDIAALRATVDRSNRKGACAAPSRAKFSACESSSF